MTLLGVVAFGVLSVAFLRRALSHDLYVIINSEGFYDNGSGLWSGAGWIRWKDVAEIRTSTYMGHPSIEIIPADREAFLQRFSWLVRLERTAFGYPPVVLRPPLMPISRDELADQMRRYLQAAHDPDHRASMGTSSNNSSAEADAARTLQHSSCLR